MYAVLLFSYTFVIFREIVGDDQTLIRLLLRPSTTMTVRASQSLDFLSCLDIHSSLTFQNFVKSYSSQALAFSNIHFGFKTSLLSSNILLLFREILVIRTSPMFFFQYLSKQTQCYQIVSPNLDFDINDKWRL